MIKNICQLRFRSLLKNDTEFTEIKISHSGNVLEISDEYPDAGKVYNYHLTAELQEKAFYRYDNLQFDVFFADGTHLLVGNNEYPAFLQTSEDLDIATITVDWQDIYPPVFAPVS